MYTPMLDVSPHSFTSVKTVSKILEINEYRKKVKLVPTTTALTDCFFRASGYTYCIAISTEASDFMSVQV